MTLEAYRQLTWPDPFGHPLAGPVYVNGAEPGDTLAVTLHKITLDDWGWTDTDPHYAYLGDELGDTHAAQGHGEVSGTAIEAPARIIYELKVLKGGRSIAEPQYETNDFYAVTAFALTLDEAAKKATRYMIDYLAETYGLERHEANMLCSVAADLKIGEVVDENVLVSMHISKSLFNETR